MSSISLSGSWNTTSPNFTGSASINVTSATVNLGPASGNVTADGSPLDPTNGVTLTDCTGNITVTAGSVNTLDSVSLQGNADNVLSVSATPNALSADQNTPATFQIQVNTSFADTYNLTAQAPPGWTVTIDTNGNVVATPAPGLQAGTYPIQVVAQSTTIADLVAQTTVEVTINPTTPGINFSVTPDSVYSVPFNGAQIPSAFQATIQNLGPAADTFALTFPNLPTGFTVLSSGATVTIPAGQTGILGVYLQPTGSLPAPGTQVTFTATATSESDPTITQTVNVTFTIPEIDAVTLTPLPTTVNITPGGSSNDTISIVNAGNVPQNVAIDATGSLGLTITGVTTPVPLGVGGSTTQALTFNVDPSIPLNSTLTATVTYGPALAQDVLTVTKVIASPGAVTAGAMVDVTASILNYVGQAASAGVSYSVFDANGVDVFNSTAVTLALATVASETVVDLGSFSTTGLAAGQYTVIVNAVDDSNPALNSAGQGRVQINPDITASLTVDQDSALPGDVTVNNTLTFTSTATAPITLAIDLYVPTNTGVAVVPNSFSLMPTNVLNLSNDNDYQFSVTLSPSNPTLTILWQTTVTGLQAGEARIIVDESTVNVMTSGGPEQLTLAPVILAGVPATQTLQIPINVVVPGRPGDRRRVSRCWKSRQHRPGQSAPRS